MIDGLLARHHSNRRIVRRKVHRKLGIEVLEDRCLLSVNSLGDEGDANPGDGVCDTAYYAGVSPASGLCTLRAAIEEANVSPGADVITFGVSGTITVASPLSVGDGVTIDGGSQHSVELRGPGASTAVDGLVLIGANSTVRGLVINNFFVEIRVGSDGNTIAGNFIGTDFTGTAAFNGASGTGILISGGSNNTISGNVISGNDFGISIESGTGNRIEGNTIGTKAGCLDHAYDVCQLHNGYGLDLYSSGNTVTRNTLAFNSALIFRNIATTTLTGNVIYRNGDVSLDQSSVSLNMSSATRENFGTAIAGTFHNTPNTLFTISFFTKTACSDSNTTPLGSGTVTTDANGDARDAGGNLGFNASLPFAPAGDGFITATASDSNGNIWEFSQCKPLTGNGGSFTGALMPDSGAEWVGTPYRMTAIVDTPGTAVQFQVTRGATVVTTGQSPADTCDKFGCRAFFAYQGSLGSDTIQATVNGTVIGNPATVEWINKPTDVSSDIRCTMGVLDYQNGGVLNEKSDPVIATPGSLQSVVVTVGNGPLTNGAIDPAKRLQGVTVNFRANRIDDITNQRILFTTAGGAQHGGVTNSDGQEAYNYVISGTSDFEHRVVGQFQGQTFLCKKNVVWGATTILPLIDITPNPVNVGDIVQIKVTLRIERSTPNGVTEVPVPDYKLTITTKTGGPPDVPHDVKTDMNGVATFEYTRTPSSKPSLDLRAGGGTEKITVTGTGKFDGADVFLPEVTRDIQWLPPPRLCTVNTTPELPTRGETDSWRSSIDVVDLRNGLPASGELVTYTITGPHSDTFRDFTVDNTEIVADRNTSPGTYEVDARLNNLGAAYVYLNSRFKPGIDTITVRTEDGVNCGTVTKRFVDTKILDQGNNQRVAFDRDELTGVGPLTVDFDNITPAGKGVGLEFKAVTPDEIPPRPPNFRLGDPPLLFDLRLDDPPQAAVYTGIIHVCVTFDPRKFPPGSTVAFAHYEGGAYQTKATAVVQQGQDSATICGDVTSFSPFVVAEIAGQGAMTATVIRRRLVIVGDDQDNFIQIGPGATADSLRISGNGTVINGQNGPLELTGVRSGIQINSGPGNDRVFFDGATTPIAIRGTVVINSSDGDDNIELNSTTISGSFRLDTGLGDDTVRLIDTVLSGGVGLLTGADSDTVMLQHATLTGKLLMDLGSENDRLTATDSVIQLKAPRPAARTTRRVDSAQPAPTPRRKQSTRSKGPLVINGGAGDQDIIDAGVLSVPNMNRNQFDTRLIINGFENQLS